MKDKFIIKPFNLVYITLFIINVLICLFFFKLTTIFNARQVLLGVSLFNLVMYIIYRHIYTHDKEYIDIAYPGQYKVNKYVELPLNPCNILVIITPFAYIFHNEWFLSYIFFYTFFMPILAMLMPCVGFDKYSVFKFRILWYYESHYFLLMNLPLMLYTGYFVPTYINVLYGTIILLVIGFIVHLINNYLVKKNLSKKANFFYTRDHEEISILKFFRKLIPIDFLYVIPALILYGLLYLLLVFVINVL